MLTLLFTAALAQEPFIVEGETATAADFPASGALIAVGNLGDIAGQSFVCSGTLIAPDVVLTAAHCMNLEAELGVTLDDFWWVFSRQLDLTEHGFRFDHELPDDGVASIDWVYHPDYDFDSVGPRDIGLVFLERPIEDWVYVVTEDEDEALAVGDESTAVGWGLQDADGSVSDGTNQIKMMATGPLTDLNARWLSWEMDETGASVCSGDSGGSLYVFPDGETRLAGVTSNGSIGCRGVSNFGRIQRDREWVDDEMRLRCEDGTRSWCLVDGIPDPDNPPELVVDDPPALPAAGCSSAPLSPLWLALLPVWRRYQRKSTS